jgi:transketolase
MRLGKAGEPDLTANAIEPFQIGKVRYLKKGKDIAILSYGTMMDMAFEIANQLEEKGKSVSILSCHTIKPLDSEGIKQVLANHERVVVMEEHVPHGGLGSRVKEIAWDSNARCKLDCFSLKDKFIHFYGSYRELLEVHGISVPAIVSKLSK